eukprot:753986-Hanusia_phi.AAC.7
MASSGSPSCNASARNSLSSRKHTSCDDLDVDPIQVLLHQSPPDFASARARQLQRKGEGQSHCLCLISSLNFFMFDPLNCQTYYHRLNPGIKKSTFRASMEDSPMSQGPGRMKNPSTESFHQPMCPRHAAHHRNVPVVGTGRPSSPRRRSCGKMRQGKTRVGGWWVLRKVPMGDTSSTDR